ncbi:MAG: hypothetical protein ORN24_00330 [Burkholderiales bacterium]|jgi:hypothetical protein|nr:hypothetical protein [Burkholderiales bacterium]
MKKTNIITLLFFLSLTNFATAYSVTMCDDGSSSADPIAGTEIGISVWNAQWTNNKQFTAPVGNCIYVSGLSGGDFVQFGKLFVAKALY